MKRSYAAGEFKNNQSKYVKARSSDGSMRWKRRSSGAQMKTEKKRLVSRNDMRDILYYSGKYNKYRSRTNGPYELSSGNYWPAGPLAPLAIAAHARDGLIPHEIEEGSPYGKLREKRKKRDSIIGAAIGGGLGLGATAWVVGKKRPPALEVAKTAGLFAWPAAGAGAVLGYARGRGYDDKEFNMDFERVEAKDKLRQIEARYPKESIGKSSIRRNDTTTLREDLERMGEKVRKDRKRLTGRDISNDELGMELFRLLRARG